MIAGLGRFLAELRREGVVVSPAEWLDAIQALRLTGLEDRRRFRSALRATLVKRARQRETFDRVFDRFFAPPPGREKRGRRGRAGGAGLATTRSEPDAGTARGVREGAGLESRGRMAEPRGRSVSRLVQAVRDGAVQPSGRLRRAIVDGRGQGAPGVAGEPRGDDSSPARRSLRARMSADAEREIAEAVPRMIERIRLRNGRRWRRAARGSLYLRRIFRDNLAHGGVPFVLPRRRRRPRRPRVLLLVDVSWSCSRAAALFLWMAGAFLRFDRRTRILFFVDRPVEATRHVERWLQGLLEVPGRAAGARTRRGGRLPGGRIAPRGRAFADLLDAVPGLNPDASSDYGRVFHQLHREASRWCGRDTLLVILGDGRSNYVEPLDWALGDLAERCARTIWLVPEPRGEWGSGDSALADYLPRIDLAVEVRDLHGLGRGVAELVRSS
jgi:uncharacterized protein with von Willebrand factor type A (vWA) domain